MSSPFEYPDSPLVRRHGPLGYEWAISYRPWLRDEFSFRCAFCLIREAWLPNDLEVEHFEPAAKAPDVELDYNNLLYACRNCNAMKGSRTVPDPTFEFVRGAIAIDDNGALHAKSLRARELVLTLGLNAPRMRSFRRLWIGIVRMAKEHDPELYCQMMGYPKDLPDLSTLRPPSGNDKPEGVESSFFARRSRGKLSEVYRF